MNWKDFWLLVLITVFRAAILGVCAYVVFWRGYSGWWFVLAVALCISDVGEKP